MKLVCVFVCIFVFREISCDEKISSLDAPDDNESTSLSPEELDKMQDINVIKKHIKKVQGELEEYKRQSEISGFLCVCHYLRQMYSQEYKFAQKMAPGKTCVDVWNKYVNESTREPAIRLRLGEGNTPPLLQPYEYHSFSESRCESYNVYCKYTSNHENYEQVLAHCMEGSNTTILEILQNEESKDLLKVTYMRFENLYAQAMGMPPFSYLVLEKNGEKYAVPQLGKKNKQAH